MISFEIAAARELVDHWEVKMWRLSVIQGKNLRVRTITKECLSVAGISSSGTPGSVAGNEGATLERPVGASPLSPELLSIK